MKNIVENIRTRNILPALLLFFVIKANAQITTPITRANFGVDADLTANFFNGSAFGGNDDWFGNGLPGSGVQVIDSTGAAALRNLYVSNPATRGATFVRHMNFPVFSQVNNRILYDALFVRDHFGTDSTAFNSSNKNAQNPAEWSPGITPVPDKNDIKDVFVHLRRNGPRLADSLWFFGGISLEGTTGNRYFDFELYQTDMYYDAVTGKFLNYGVDSGHTAWQFDASGNVTRVGDIIFTAEFSSSSLTLLEARIWVNRTVYTTTTPANFIWGTQFDGNTMTSAFGYANILPKSSGSFYSGLQCANGSWAGPFANINTTGVFTTYTDRQFMEISVNLTKIGLDPYTLIGFGDGCKLPFKKVFAKTRSSTSFTSELKDFIGPYSFGQPPPTDASANFTLFCNSMQSSTLTVTNPIATSIYRWTTTNGHIVTSPATGTSVVVDSAGMYVVSQTLFSGCAPYSTDTIRITRTTCALLSQEKLDLEIKQGPGMARLTIKADPANDYREITLERESGSGFEPIAHFVPAQFTNGQLVYDDPVNNPAVPRIRYRLRQTGLNSQVVYSRIVSFTPTFSSTGLSVIPNPVETGFRLILPAFTGSGTLALYDLAGRMIRKYVISPGNTFFEAMQLAPGIYEVIVETGSGTYRSRLVKK